VTKGLEGRRLYLCTPDRPDLEAFVSECLRGGVDVVQLRDKQLEARALLDRGALLQRVCAAHDVPFLMNDRPDLALALGCDGVHVGQDDVPVSLAREILGRDAIIGLSTHSEADLADALGQDADYLSAGPVVQTPTKPGRPGTGIAYVQEAVQRSTLPVYVTGGVNPDSVGALTAVGVTHFVAVRWLTDAKDPRTAALELRRAIEVAIEGAERP
jgi:thiamine-phosphate pyrophosphorylase